MSKTVSLLSALLCTFIWGTTFIAQDTGMDDIGPFTFNAVRFFVGFLAIVPLAILFEAKSLKSEFKLDFKTFAILSLLIGLSLFLGSALQQVALLYTDVATSVYSKATCCNADPKKRERPIKRERIAKVLKSNLNSDFKLFASNKIAKGTIAKNPTKNLTALKVKGPISSIPVSCAINVVPQIKVHNKALSNDTVFDIIFR